MKPSFQPGDAAIVGKPGRNKLHWTVVEVIESTGMIHLISPFSGQRRFEPAGRLTPHESTINQSTRIAKEPLS